MSTIASPREPALRRIPSSTAAGGPHQIITTPSSSRRASVETIRSAAGSPNPSTMLSPTTAANVPGAAKRNRAALREYYHLKSTAATPALEITEADDGNAPAGYSEIPASEIDRPGFDVDAYVRKTLATSGLESLLRTYTRVLGEIRALDAEKKGLVYDNYSRLITATETIRKMRTTMDPLNPMAATLDPAIAHIYTQAKALRDAVRASIPDPATNPPSSTSSSSPSQAARTRQLAAAVLQTPDRLRRLVREGRTEEAQEAWERPRRLLEIWKAQGVGGADEVAACLADGDAALRGKGPPKGWHPAEV